MQKIFNVLKILHNNNNYMYPTVTLQITAGCAQFTAV